MSRPQTQVQHQPFRMGLFFRVGRWSWFWGRGTPPSSKRAEAPVPPQAVPGSETWSALADWLRHMHAQADRLPVNAGPGTVTERRQANEF